MALGTIVSAARKQAQIQKTVSVQAPQSAPAETVEQPHIKKEIIEADEKAYFDKRKGRSTSISSIVGEIEAGKRLKGKMDGKTWETCKSMKHCDTGKHACTKFMRFCVKENCSPKFMD